MSTNVPLTDSRLRVAIVCVVALVLTGVSLPFGVSQPQAPGEWVTGQWEKTSINNWPAFKCCDADVYWMAAWPIAESDIIANPPVGQHIRAKGPKYVTGAVGEVRENSGEAVCTG